MSLSFSFIIPVYEDAEALEKALEVLTKFECRPEVIVVDASPDKEAAKMLAEKYGVVFAPAEKASRGAQLAQGARIASGDVFLFHHADTYLTAAHMQALEIAMRETDVKAGAFFKDVSGHYPAFVWATGLYRWYANWRGILYGDQSVFVRRDFYDELGGMRNIPIMEDVDFSGRLRRGRGVVVLLDPPLRTSMRKFKREGLYRRKLKNMLLILLFRFGVSPERIYGWYYGK